MPERTCIGCRGVFAKGDVVRIIAAAQGVVPDYRERLSGRAAYVCPRRECIGKALSGGKFPRALKSNVSIPSVEDFTSLIASAIRERIRSLVTMAAKAGKVAAGYSAVRDGLEKNRVTMVLFTNDIADGTREKVAFLNEHVISETLFNKGELGAMLGREAVGVIAFLDDGFAHAVIAEVERLKGLLNTGQ